MKRTRLGCIPHTVQASVSIPVELGMSKEQHGLYVSASLNYGLAGFAGIRAVLDSHDLLDLLPDSDLVSLRALVRLQKLLVLVLNKLVRVRYMGLHSDYLLCVEPAILVPVHLIWRVFDIHLALYQESQVKRKYGSNK